MANCIHCNNKIILIPSAAERAKKFGGVASDYANLFRAHSECTIKYTKEQTSALIRKHYAR